MQTTLTINQKQFDADYAGVGYRGWLKAQIHDTRMLSEIAPEVEGSEIITLEDNTGTTTFTGYTQLMRIEWIDDVSVVIMLAKEDDRE